MSVEREMSLAEWCAKLPSLHLVNQELSTLNKQLAALAEQNEKMREALEVANGHLICYLYNYGDSGVHQFLLDTISLPDLATPVLNQIKSEAYREAAGIVGPEDSYQDGWFKAKADSCAKLRAKADELEKNNG